MTQDEYKHMWSKLFEDSIELESRRTALENDLNEVKARIESVKQALAHIRPLAGIPTGDHLQGLGMTDAIRAILRTSESRMSATDVRKTLMNKGFDLSGYSSPMSSIYTVLGRLTDESNGSNEAIREQDDNRNVFYRWKPDPSDYSQKAEISDDDIPF